MRIFNKKIISALVLSLAFTAPVFAAEAVDLDELLEQVKQGRVKDAAEAQARVEEFRANRANQQRALQQKRNQQAAEERRSERMEQTFEDNDAEIIELELALQERLGDLKELFGVLQQAAGDAIGQFSNSITQVQFPERNAYLKDFATKMGNSNRMASLEEIERLWFEMQREMTESGRVSKFTTTVVNANGEESLTE